MSKPLIIISQERSLPEARFCVVVRDGEGETQHKVDVSADYVDQLGVKRTNSKASGDAAVNDLVCRSFRFLLDREEKDSILSEFPLSEIETHFPEYREKITDSLLQHFGQTVQIGYGGQKPTRGSGDADDT